MQVHEKSNRKPVNRMQVLFVVILVLAALTASAGTALAHTRTEVGPYTIVLGWMNEPVIVGERNALVLEITEGETPVEGLEASLELTVFYGGKSFIGQVAPFGDPGVYRAEIFPTVRGQYEVQLTGLIGAEAIDVILEPEEVLPANVLQFPETQPDPAALAADLEDTRSELARLRSVAYAAMAAGAVGLLLGLGALVRSFRSVFTVVLLFGLAACAAPADPAPETESVEHVDEHVEDGEHTDDGYMRIPNDGAVIEIVLPAEGAEFASGEDIVVEISIENFTLNQDGTHWHVYVDRVSYGMVVGETTTQVLRNLEPGTHTITAYLANGDHEEMEDGGEVTITIIE